MPHVAPGVVFEFGDFRLDCGRFELVRGGDALRVERKPLELLILLVSRQGQLVTRAEIAQRLWSSEVFVDTEHGINTAIRKLRYILRDDSEEPKFIQTVTGMGYRFIAPVTAIDGPTITPPDQSASAAPPADEPVPTPPPSISEPSKKPLGLQVAIVARFIALTVALVFIAIPHKVVSLLHRDPNPPITSLAVIPLDNLSGDPNQEYFADGMTDELITMLAKDSTLRITSRTTVMQYKGAHRPLPEIARALNVNAIVEGSVSRSGDQVHMNLQLIRADNDSHLWAESYDRSTNDAITLPDEAARAIAGKLNRSLPSVSAARHINPVAHDAYLRGEYLWYQGKDTEAIKEFNHALSVQPDYAAAWSGLASSYAQGSTKSEFVPDDAMPKAESAAARALALDPSLADAHLCMGAIILTFHRDLAHGDREILKAIELDSRFTQAVHFHAMALAAMNRPSEGIEMQKKASELDPIARPWALPRAYLWAREYNAALNDALAKLSANANAEYLSFWVSEIYRVEGKEKEAAPYLERWLLFSSGQNVAPEIQRANREGGYKALVAWQLDQLEKKSRTQYVSPVAQASLNAKLGNRANALALLEQAVSKHDPEVIWIQCNPEFDFLHGEPRYRAIVKGIGLAPAY